MINLDLTKVFHPRFTDLLAGFLPGLFFEICVLLANPEFAQRIIKSTGADRYIQLFVVLFLAFILGSALIQWVRFIQIQFMYSYRHLLQWKPKILDWRITRAMNAQAAQTGQQGQSPTAPSKRWLKLHAAQSRRVEDKEFIRHSQEAWGVAATQLLKRYGIEVTSANWDWGPWAEILGAGEIRAQDRRGYLFIMAQHATGWSGLLACYFAPTLRTWPFALFCLFLIVYGLLHDWQVASTLSDPRSQWTLALRCTMAELRNRSESKEPDRESTEHSST
jgi:hypothetical protein